VLVANVDNSALSLSFVLNDSNSVFCAPFSNHNVEDDLLSVNSSYGSTLSISPIN